VINDLGLWGGNGDVELSQMGLWLKNKFIVDLFYDTLFKFFGVITLQC